MTMTLSLSCRHHNHQLPQSLGNSFRKMVSLRCSKTNDPTKLPNRTGNHSSTPNAYLQNTKLSEWKQDHFDPGPQAPAGIQLTCATGAIFFTYKLESVSNAINAHSRPIVLDRFRQLMMLQKELNYQHNRALALALLQVQQGLATSALHDFCTTAAFRRRH